VSISAGLEWVGNLGPGAEAAASGVDRLTASLRALQAVQGAVAGGGKGGPGVGSIGALGAAANRAAVIQEKSAADLAKIQAKGAADIATVEAKAKASAQSVQLKQEADQARAIAAMQATAQAAALKQETDRQKAIADVVKGQAKTADAAYLAQVNGAESQKRAAEKAALVEQQGAQKAAQIREKAIADQARIEAKRNADIAKEDAKIKAKLAADIARDTHKENARLARSQSKVTQVSEATTSGFGGGARAILEGKGVQGALGAFGGRGAKIAAIGKTALDLGRSVLNVVGDLSSLSFAFGKAVVNAQAYREDVTEAFKTVTGSAEAGAAVMKRALATADRLGTARAETVGQFLDLTTKGFQSAEVERIIGSLNDLSTIDPNASMEGLTKVIGKVKATGRLNQETLNELSTFGLEQSDVLSEIGKMIGKNDKEVLKALSSAGGIRGLGVEPILRAINKQVGGGTAGDKAAEKSNRNLSSLLRRVGDIPENILFDVEVGDGLESIKVVLRSVLDFFKSGSKTAEATSKVIGDAFNSLIKGITGAESDDPAELGRAVQETIATVVDAIDEAKPAIEAFGSILRAAFLFTSMALGGIGILISGINGIGSSISGLPESFGELGSSIIDGLVGGISGGVQRVIDAVKGVASSALSSAKSVLGIASPSKEFARVGVWSAEGMARGFDTGASGVTAAARLMAQDAAVAASMALPAMVPVDARGAASVGGSPIVVQLPPGLIVINVGSGVDAEALAEQLEGPVTTVLTRVLRRIASEGGLN
jgi:hypothetical protein